MICALCVYVYFGLYFSDIERFHIQVAREDGNRVVKIEILFLQTSLLDL